MLNQIIMARFTFIRNIATKKSASFLNDAKRLQEEHLNNRIIFGNVYLKTHLRSIIEFRVEWLEFKAQLLIKTFRLNTPHQDSHQIKPHIRR